VVLRFEGLHFEPFHQPFFVCDRFFQDRVSRTTCLDWLRTTFLLISASWVVRITGVRYCTQPQHWCF
jgi:hypothetical protein